MKEERTETDIVLNAPIKVTFGGQEYSVKILAIKYSSEWRAKVAGLLAGLPKYAEVTTDTPDEFGNAMTALLVTMPDTVVDLFFDYARDLPRDEVEKIATDAEMDVAFEAIVKVTFPLAKSLTRALESLAV